MLFAVASSPVFARMPSNRLGRGWRRPDDLPPSEPIIGCPVTVKILLDPLKLLSLLSESGVSLDEVVWDHRMGLLDELTTSIE